jgi:hypothetical protein
MGLYKYNRAITCIVCFILQLEFLERLADTEIAVLEDYGITMEK